MKNRNLFLVLSAALCFGLTSCFDDTTTDTSNPSTPDNNDNGNTQPDNGGDNGGNTDPDNGGGNGGNTDPDNGGGNTNPEGPDPAEPEGPTDPDNGGGDTKPDGPTDPDNGNNNPDNGDVDTSLLTVKSFNDAIHNSKPTKVLNKVSYFAVNSNVTLYYNSILNVEYGNVTEAEYIYSYQKLNPIGSSEMISTYTGKSYAREDNYGVFNGTNIEWKNSLDSTISLFTFEMTDALFDSKKIENDTLSGTLSTEKCIALFGNEYGQNMSNATISVRINDTLTDVRSLNIYYKDIKTNSDVNINTSYSYDYIDVQIPE